MPGLLSAQVYNLTKPIGGAYPEVQYFLKILKGSKPKALEVGVGTGALLVPLMEAGVAIDGLDASGEMLAVCRENCNQKNLYPTLYKSAVHEMGLPELYQNIIMTSGPFMRLWKREEALLTLKNFHRHLMVGGKLYIDLGIPYIDQSQASVKKHRGTVQCPDGSTILIEGHTTYQRVEQIENVYLRYEKWKNGQLLATELQHVPLRWYGKFEFISLLKEQGFTDIQVCSDFEEQSTPNDESHRMCFSATKA